MHSIADRSCGNGLFRQRDSCFKHRQRARPVLIEYKVDSFTKMDLKLSAQQIKREMYPALDMVMYITAHGTDHWRHQELRQEGGAQPLLLHCRLSPLPHPSPNVWAITLPLLKRPTNAVKVIYTCCRLKLYIA